MPNLSLITLATGARQLVVQDALETTWCRAGSYFSSLTPNTTVRHSPPLAGPLKTTFLAPAWMCLAASSGLLNLPVDSITYSTPSSFQGSRLGSPSARILTSRPLTTIDSLVEPTSRSYMPYVESYTHLTLPTNRE